MPFYGHPKNECSVGWNKANDGAEATGSDTNFDGRGDRFALLGNLRFNQLTIVQRGDNALIRVSIQKESGRFILKMNLPRIATYVERKGKEETANTLKKEGEKCVCCKKQNLKEGQ